MDRRQLTSIILASLLVTLDGTITTIALPTIGRDLSASMSRLQWIANAPLLILAALLLPARTLADRFGLTRVLRIGLVVFLAGSVTSLSAHSAVVLISAKLIQGAGAASGLNHAVVRVGGLVSVGGGLHSRSRVLHVRPVSKQHLGRSAPFAKTAGSGNAARLVDEAGR